MIQKNDIVPIIAADTVPCRIAFERGKERHFRFLAVSAGTSGWLILAEEIPLRKDFGVVRVCAPLAGCNVRMALLHSFLFSNSVKYCPLKLGKFNYKNFGNRRRLLLGEGETPVSYSGSRNLFK